MDTSRHAAAGSAEAQGPRSSRFLIHYRIQSVRGREALVERLLPRLPPAVEIVVDEEAHDPNPWRNYQRCLSDIPSYAQHLVVLQDDVDVCHNFVAAVERVVEARPGSVIQLFTGGLGGQTRMSYLAAIERGKRFSLVHGPGIHHVVAVIWPRPLAEHFLEWAGEARLPGRPPRSDDAIVGLWARTTGTQVLATVPSLVEHPDTEPSTIGKQARAGGNRGRVAIQYIGGDDPLLLDWSQS